ncbi:MAG: PAS domain S-box protein [Gammaproteobacteria bacterium]|nr:PAS domain S-box protein [Gammaproteobacteria bacterium]
MELLEQKIIEDELRKSQQFNETILNASPDIIYIYDIEDKINIYSNQGIVRVLGYSIAQVKQMGQGMIETLMHPDDFKLYIDVTIHKYQVLKDGEFIEHEYRMKHQNGKWCLLSSKETVFLRNTNGNPKQIFGLVSDVSKRREDEEKLRRSEKKYRDLFNSINDGICLHEIIYVDNIPVDYRILDINPKYEEYTGIKKGDAVGAVASCLYKTAKAPYLDEYANVAITGNSISFETYFEPMDKHFIISVFSPEKHQFATVFQDVTERKKHDAQIQQALKMEAVGTLAGGIAHDFNNMLSIILGNIELLQRQFRHNDRVSKRLDAIEKSGWRAAELTHQILGFSRGKPDQQRSVSINVIIRQMEQLIARSLTPEIEVQLKLAEGLRQIGIDPGDFEDALLNLCINARDAMAGTGKIVIESRNTYIDQNYCRHNEGISPGWYVELSVSDTGCGISPQNQARIYEPFFSTKEQGKGTGLGLSLVFGFVKRSRGVIKCYSEEKIGTTFRLFFPALTEEGGDTGVEVTGSGAVLPQGKETLLVVDDEEPLILLVCAFLRPLGYTVHTATNGREALRQLHQHPEIALMISDVVMPGGMNGYELAAQASALYPRLQLLLSSGYTEAAMAVNGQARFDSNLLLKPYRREVLALRVRELLDSLPETVRG